MTTELMVKDDAPIVVARNNALAPDLASLVERVLTDPNADVSKLHALLDVNERILDRNAKGEFDTAFAAMWPELPEIDEKGAIKNRSGAVQSRYARYEDIQTAIRPVLTRHGFSLRHRTEWPEGRAGVIRIVGILTHRSGHAEESAFEAPADKSDFRSDVQSQGSTISYGKRYTTCDLLNIITRGQDNDGQQKAPEPDGYAVQWDDLTAVADEGTDALEQAWRKAPKGFKEFTLNHRKAEWAGLKAKAAKVAK